MQVDPIKLTLKAPGTKRLKLKYDKLLSTSAFNFILRRYSEEMERFNKLTGVLSFSLKVRRCRLTLSNPS